MYICLYIYVYPMPDVFVRLCKYVCLSVVCRVCLSVCVFGCSLGCLSVSCPSARRTCASLNNAISTRQGNCNQHPAPRFTNFLQARHHGGLKKAQQRAMHSLTSAIEESSRFKMITKLHHHYVVAPSPLLQHYPTPFRDYSKIRLETPSRIPTSPVLKRDNVGLVT